ncbi:prolyl 3-hydroxylase sudestada1-like isoform X3 [Malaya genurostris]|uniref:prolyl 3-hydroxylase sudestada1-like isoform X3 n=1 Tax=Malaya genurostris TaxID=325434 RepID=UPI0026F402EA|nr:prolyl 3-hydroxylase sudestada1-like isoform X3 [Malaya genurostris]XP_058467314.1 prolyl 3-hydroxylase sudestada1-like isoform X3 [Malaya genurostris]XP_058467315.1 prolyl 3-hydroxylase sudestada1-like isoform X3 [Malaya genurostris]
MMGAKRLADDEPELNRNKVQRLDEPVSINRRYLTDEFRLQFSQSWSRLESLRGSCYELKSYPFQLAVLRNFLSENEQEADLTKQFEHEFSLLEWKRKQMDLYEFYQTMDLSGIQTPLLAGFYNMLKQKLLPLMQKLTGISLTHVSASCSMYNAGDYLLVHDDLLTDRRIAFVFYLSPWDAHRKWTSVHGGALELFKADENVLPVFPVTDSIFPQNNQLAFFKVCDRSFHQVGEVTTFEYPRLTINGWLHGPQNSVDIPPSSIIVDTHYFSPQADEMQLTEWINNVYLIDEVKHNIQKKVEMFSEVSLEEFLTPEIFNVMGETLQTNKELIWSIKGPAHLRKYEILDFSTVTSGPLLDLYKLFSSRNMFRLLYEYTGLDLAGSKVKSPQCAIELQRWQKGCYTVLGDLSSYSDCTLDVVFYLNAQDNVGVLTYLVPEGDQQPSSNSDEQEEDDPVLLTIYPKDNVLNVVYRTEGTTKFTKYVSRNTFLEQEHTQGGHQYTYILSCSYKE